MPQSIAGTSSTTITSMATTAPDVTTTTTVKLPASGAAPVPSSGRLAPENEPVQIISVTDGDTVVVAINGVEERVRLIGINTPEDGECLADQATVALQALVADRDVVLSVDVNDRDQYGRLLRYMWVDDVFVNETMVGSGLAVARRYEPDTSLANILDAAQDRARQDGRGMWGSNVCGDSSDADIVISDIQYDAPGNDNDNLNGEWVKIENRGEELVDLSNWVLKDESASHRYTFGPGSDIEAGAEVVVYTGCGTDSVSEMFWCVSRSAVWNNTGDTGFLLDPSGNIVDIYEYSA